MISCMHCWYARICPAATRPIQTLEMVEEEDSVLVPGFRSFANQFNPDAKTLTDFYEVCEKGGGLINWPGNPR